MMSGLPPEKNWLEKMLTGSAAATILVALVGQAVFSIVYQIRNNEQQNAGIEANKNAVTELRSNIVNLQTPLSQMVLRMEGRLAALETEHKTFDLRMTASDVAINNRIDTIDRTGTRAMEVVVSNQQRVLSSLERYSERMSATDQRVNDVQSKGVLLLQNQLDLANSTIKRLDEQQTRIIQAVDNQYNMLQEFLRQYSDKPIKPGPTPGSKKQN